MGFSKDAGWRQPLGIDVSCPTGTVTNGVGSDRDSRDQDEPEDHWHLRACARITR